MVDHEHEDHQCKVKWKEGCGGLDEMVRKTLAERAVEGPKKRKVGNSMGNEKRVLLRTRKTRVEISPKFNLRRYLQKKMGGRLRVGKS
ncbi:MAG TPA: hypothetical protein EYO33_12275 [Phycisphaerales bacterium]|nr:hypothetical protein [Phycisphaerales bacterium]